MVGSTVEQLHETLDKLLADDVRAAPQAADVVELERARARLDAEIARRLVAMSRTGEHTAYGYETVKQFLVARTRCAGAEAYRQMRTASEIDALSDTQAAWQAGQLTSGHADVIAKARHAARADQRFGEFEPAMLRFAKSATPEGLAQLLAQWRDAVDNDLDRDGSDSRAAKLHEDRRVSFARSLEGCGLGEILLDAEGADVVETALNTAAGQLRREGDRRTPAQRRADALVEIGRTFLSVQSGRANLPHVLVLWSVETMLGDALGDSTLASGARIDPATASRIACDAFVQHVLVGDDGVPLTMGRATRTFTPDQFRAMVVRDGGCRGVGCNAPPSRCQGHHVRPWKPDGRTDLGNGALFCIACHLDLHEHGIQVRGVPSRELRFYDKHGTAIGSTRPRGPTPLIPLEPDRRGLLIELYAPGTGIDDPGESSAA